MNANSATSNMPSGLRKMVSTFVAICLASCMVAGCNVQKISDNCYAGPAPIPGMGHVEKLKERGVKTIVNVRTNSMKRVEREARALGLNYFQIQSGVFKVPQEKEIKEFVAIVSKPENQPVYVCCTLGSDRTAYYVACYRMACLNWSDDKAITAMDEGLKQWWPIFRKYDKFLRRHSDLMRAEAAYWKEKYGNNQALVSTDKVHEKAVGTAETSQ
jgi:protein-tyrosine phosphatase